MNTIFALMFVVLYTDGSTKLIWPKTYESKIECTTKGLAFFNGVSAEVDKTPNHNIKEMTAHCVPQKES